MSNTTYRPHKFQQLFHKSNARFRTLIAGRRGGKTIAGTVEALWWADKRPGSVGWVVAPTYPMLRDVNIPAIKEFLPGWAYSSWNKNENRIEFKNGSEISFRSAEDPDRLRGVGLDWLWLDEASFMKPQVWDVIYPTLTDTGGVMWVTTTPQGYDWVYQKLYKPAQEEDEDFDAWQYRTIDNPYIDPELVEQAQKDMNEQMFRQEYLATFEKFTGLVYPDFEKGMVREFPEDEIQAPLYFIGIDVGYTNPTAVVLMAEDALHRLWVLDEWYESHKTAGEISKAVKEMVGDRAIEAYIVDPASKGRHQTSQMSMEDQLHEADVPVTPGDNDVMAGINRVTRLLRNNALVVHPRCVNVIREFELYSWKENKPGDESNADERPIKAHDHLMDALRYVAMSRPDWFARKDTDRYGRIIDDGGGWEQDNLIDL